MHWTTLLTALAVVSLSDAFFFPFFNKGKGGQSHKHGYPAPHRIPTHYGKGRPGGHGHGHGHGKGRPNGNYGPPVRPTLTYGPPVRPTQTYGPPVRPTLTYGPPVRPTQTYGPPVRPSTTYGPPKPHPLPPSKEYGPPTTGGSGGTGGYPGGSKGEDGYPSGSEGHGAGSGTGSGGYPSGTDGHGAEGTGTGGEYPSGTGGTGTGGGYPSGTGGTGTGGGYPSGTGGAGTGGGYPSDTGGTGTGGGYQSGAGGEGVAGGGGYPGGAGGHGTGGTAAGGGYPAGQSWSNAGIHHTHFHSHYHSTAGGGGPLATLTSAPIQPSFTSPVFPTLTTGAPRLPTPAAALSSVPPLQLEPRHRQQAQPRAPATTVTVTQVAGAGQVPAAYLPPNQTRFGQGQASDKVPTYVQPDASLAAAAAALLVGHSSEENVVELSPAWQVEARPQAERRQPADQIATSRGEILGWTRSVGVPAARQEASSAPAARQQASSSPAARQAASSAPIALQKDSFESATRQVTSEASTLQRASSNAAALQTASSEPASRQVTLEGIPSVNAVDQQGPEISQVLRQLGLLRFMALVQRAGLEKVLQSQGGFTVFAFTDDGWGMLPYSLRRQLTADPGRLRQLLLHHLTPVRLRPASLGDNLVVKSASPSGAVLRINVYQMSRHSQRVVTVNGAQVLRSDASAPGGVVHAIDRALVAEARINALQYITTQECADLDFSGISSMITKLGVSKLLSQDTPLTLFLPISAAFSDPDLVAGDFSNSTTVMQNSLLYHMVPGAFYSAGLRDGQWLETLLDGQELQTQVVTDGYTRRISTVSKQAQVIRADIPVTNGVVHIIDFVLRPERNLQRCDLR